MASETPQYRPLSNFQSPPQKSDSEDEFSNESLLDNLKKVCIENSSKTESEVGEFIKLDTEDSENEFDKIPDPSPHAESRR